MTMSEPLPSGAPGGAAGHQELMKQLEEVKLKVDTGHHRDVIQWSRSLPDEGFKYFSQNDEDGVIDADFEYIGTTDKVM